MICGATIAATYDSGANVWRLRHGAGEAVRDFPGTNDFSSAALDGRIRHWLAEIHDYEGWPAVGYWTVAP